MERQMNNDFLVLWVLQQELLSQNIVVTFADILLFRQVVALERIADLLHSIDEIKR
jgi:hypothetical protein